MRRCERWCAHETLRGEPMTKRQNKVSIEGVGPIRERVEFSTDGPGVYVWEGPNGSGKSTALRAMGCLAGNDSSGLTVTDGGAEGLVEGYGVTLKIARRRSRGGELAVVSLDPDVDPSLVVDPGIKDADAADLARIAALAAIARVRPDIELFRDGLANELPADADFSKLASGEAFAAGSIAEQAKRLKLDLEKAAREQERKAELEQAEADALSRNAAKVDPGEVFDELELRGRSERAIERLAEAQAQRTAWLERKERVSNARARMERAATERGGETREEIQGALTAALMAANQAAIESTEAMRAVDDAELALKEARAIATTKRQEAESASRIVAETEKRLKLVDSHEAALADQRAIIEEGEGAEGPSVDALAQLREMKENAARAQERGAVIRAALAEREKVQEIAKRAEALRARAEMIRNAAKACWRVVAERLADFCPPRLVIMDGAIYYDHPKRAMVRFHTGVSHGEAWSLVMPAALRAVGRGGMLAMRQEAWEGLDPANRAKLVEQVVAADCQLHAAQCTDGALALTKYDPAADRNKTEVQS